MLFSSTSAKVQKYYNFKDGKHLRLKDTNKIAGEIRGYYLTNSEYKEL